MSKHESHPEAWLDRGSAQLREEEQRELARHLEHCDACALHEKLQPSLMEQLALLPGDAVLINGAIERAVRGFATAPPPAPNLLRPGRLLAMTAAGALAVGSAGVAGVWAYKSRPSTEPPAALTSSSSPDKAGAATPKRAPKQTPAPEARAREARAAETTEHEATAEELMPAPELVPEEPAREAAPSAPVRSKPRSASGGSKTSARAGTDAGHAASSADSAEPETSAGLFARANALRRSKNYTEAERSYRRLQTVFPGSPEDTLSRIVLGRLYLDQLGDARAALRQFDAYLASATHTSLRDEAMIGRALAFGQLGSAAEERAAWRRFLDAYPGSMYVPKAKARLLELGE